MESIHISFYGKASIYAVGLLAVLIIIINGQYLLIPLCLSVIIAILLRPPISWLVKKKINRVLAISAAIAVSGTLIISVGILILSQASHFGEALPGLVENFQDILHKALNWGSGYFKISPEKLNQWMGETKSDLLKNSSNFIGSTLTITGRVLGILGLIPVYVFLILLYKPILVEFIYKVAGENNRSRAKGILSGINKVVQKYLSGLIIETSVVAAMTITGLMIMGMEYAVLLGIISALLNMIPYLGVLLAMLLCTLLALITKDSAIDALYVLLIFGIVQVIDNNILVPKIIGGSVKINALISIFAVVTGGLLWGIAGMFLAIPFTAIIKVISDRIEPLNPIGILLGDEIKKSNEV